jgi:hypothetical protein
MCHDDAGSVCSASGGRAPLSDTAGDRALERRRSSSSPSAYPPQGGVGPLPDTTPSATAPVPAQRSPNGEQRRHRGAKALVVAFLNAGGTMIVESRCVRCGALWTTPYGLGCVGPAVGPVAFEAERKTQAWNPERGAFDNGRVDVAGLDARGTAVVALEIKDAHSTDNAAPRAGLVTWAELSAETLYSVIGDGEDDCSERGAQCAVEVGTMCVDDLRRHPSCTTCSAAAPSCTSSSLRTSRESTSEPLQTTPTVGASCFSSAGDGAEALKQYAALIQATRLAEIGPDSAQARSQTRTTVALRRQARVHQRQSAASTTTHRHATGAARWFGARPRRDGDECVVLHVDMGAIRSHVDHTTIAPCAGPTEMHVGKNGNADWSDPAYQSIVNRDTRDLLAFAASIPAKEIITPERVDVGRLRNQSVNAISKLDQLLRVIGGQLVTKPHEQRVKGKLKRTYTVRLSISWLCESGYL